MFGNLADNLQQQRLDHVETLVDAFESALLLCPERRKFGPHGRENIEE